MISLSHTACLFTKLYVYTYIRTLLYKYLHHVLVPCLAMLTHFSVQSFTNNYFMTGDISNFIRYLSFSRAAALSECMLELK